MSRDRVRLDEAPQVPVLREDLKSRSVSERIARLAYAQYTARYGISQSFERLHQRGGFSPHELIELLAERVEVLEDANARLRERRRA